MKILLAAFAFCIVTAYCYDSYNYAKVDEIRASNADVQDCAVKHKIDPMVVNELKRTKNYTGTVDTQCFANCILRRIGIMLADGTVNREFVESDIASECNNKYFAFGKDECEISAKILWCLTQYNIVVLAKD